MGQKEILTHRFLFLMLFVQISQTSSHFLSIQLQGFSGTSFLFKSGKRIYLTFPENSKLLFFLHKTPHMLKDNNYKQLFSWK